MTTTPTSKLADHIVALCEAFDVKLVIHPGMDPGGAGAGCVVVGCPTCGQRLRMRGRAAGVVRCPRCKQEGPSLPRYYIEVAPVMDETTYAVALHELGHCLSALGQCGMYEGSQSMRRNNVYATLRDVRLQLEEEMAAWAWARQNALEWTEVMSHVEQMTFDTYRKQARKLGVKI